MTLQTHHSAGVAESHHEEHYQQQYGEVGPQVVGKQVDEQSLPLGCREGVAPGCKGGEIMGHHTTCIFMERLQTTFHCVLH